MYQKEEEFGEWREKNWCKKKKKTLYSFEKLFLTAFRQIICVYSVEKIIHVTGRNWRKKNSWIKYYLISIFCNNRYSLELG